jgi:hypothetical protein
VRLANGGAGHHQRIVGVADEHRRRVAASDLGLASAIASRDPK